LSRKHQIKLQDVSRLMVYILGHKPYEFGLVPDVKGFVTFKELLWAMHEEPGYGYVNQGSIREVLISEDRSLFEVREKQIRALDKQWEMDLTVPVQPLPKLLFLGIRRKAHPVFMEKGLRPIEGTYYTLSPDRDMALRIGKRRDQDPVILEIMADRAQTEGTLFYAFGNLFLASEIQTRYIAGPPVPKEVIPLRDEKPKKKEETPKGFQAGTFTLDINRDMDPSRQTKGKKKKGWKEEARKFRKNR
jgi:putative RNA 2'-phosphotransferase